MRSKLFYPLLLLLLWACGATPHEVEAGGRRPASPVGPDIDTGAAYQVAIADYIEAMRTRDGSFPDTVFIGRHEELPDIGLPSVIEQVSVRIVAPAEAESLKSGDHFTYLNVFGWFTAEQVEFFVVNFKQGMRHAPDGRDDRHLYYSIRRGAEELTLDSLR